MSIKPWEILKDRFGSVFSRDLSKEAPNPASLSGAGIGRADAVGSAEYLEGGSTFNHAVEITDLNDFLEVGEHTDRRARYLEYDRMENIPEVSSALDTYCLTKDNIINTPSGNFTIEKLLEMYPNGESFLVYCYDKDNQELTIGKARNVRYTKTDIIYEINLNSEKTIKCTGDHKFLKRDGTWCEAKNLKPNDKLMPCSIRKSKRNPEYKEIYTIKDGWKYEHRFIAEKLIVKRKLKNGFIEVVRQFILRRLKQAGFKGWKDYKKNYIYSNDSVKSVTCLNNKEDVYDITTDIYHNFSCNNIIVHNSDEVTVPDIDGKIFKISTPNQGVKEELEWLFNDLLQLETEDLWSWSRNVVKNGDLFLELVIDADNPELGIQKIAELPPETVYRIETVRGRLLEFQQSYLGPDYQSIISDIKEKASQADSTIGHLPGQASVTTTGTNPTYASISGSPTVNSCIRFAPEQIVHVRIGMKRRGFYPYGVSALYAGRRIAHLLKLMEDAMVIYRLCLTGESRVRTTCGYKYIKDIKENDQVFSYDRKGNLIKTDVCYYKNNGIQPILKIKSKHTEIRGTYTHPILIHNTDTNTVEYVDLQDLIPKTHQIINIDRDDDIKVDISNHNNINLPTHVDETFAQLFGFILAKGNICNNSILFEKSSNNDLDNKYKSLLEKYFGTIELESNFYRIENQTAITIFDCLGFTSNNISIPKWAFTSSKKIRKAFIKGIIEANGLIEYNQKETWTGKLISKNKQFIEDLKEIWSSCGLCSNNIESVFSFSILKEKTDNKESYWSICLSDINLDKYEDIISIEYDGEEEVYDISVDNDLHNFIVNGTVSHNTRAPERRIFYIDIGSLPANKGEVVLERVRDKIKKKKIYNRQTGQIDERYNAWAADEDFFIPTRPESNTRIETLPGGCLAMDTKIPLLDGRILTISQMKDEYKEGKENWIYSCDPNTGKIVPGIVSWAGTTHEKAKVMKLTFDNGETITCTPDHKFPILSRGKTRADELSVGDSIIPFNTKKQKVCPSRHLEYNQVYDNELKEWVFTHRMVANYFKDNICNEYVCLDKYSDEEKKTIHHLDYNRYNNNPSNLVWMNSKDHAIYHSKHINDPIIRQRLTDGINRYFNNLSEKDIELRKTIYRKNAKKASMVMSKKLKENKEFKEEFRQKCIKGLEKSKKNNPKMWKEISINRSIKNIKMWSCNKLRNSIISKQKIRFDKELFNIAKNCFIKNNGKVNLSVQELNNDKYFINQFKILNSHIVRNSFDLSKGFTKIHFIKLMKTFGYNSSLDLKKEFNLYNNDYKKKISYKFKKNLMNIISRYIHKVKNIEELTQILAGDNKHIDITKDIINNIIISDGYKNFKQLKNEIQLYNHKITKIEFLENEIEVGTLTIDVDEKYHDYHTFAIDSIGFTYNSNLGEIDDTKYFREKLMVALKLPKNYLFQDDISVTRTSFATQDMRFARTIFRIQKIISHGLKQIAIRHLILRGFAEEDIRHLKINFTAPSDWLELSRSELLSNRFNLASNIKNSNIYDDFTILTSILNHTNEEAKEIIDRKEQQTLREQEIQAQAQVFASLATPDQEDTTSPQIDMGGTQENPSGIYGNEIPGMQGAEFNPPEFTPPSEEEAPEKTTRTPEKTKTKRFIDFADLEADEEEIDINYS